VLDLREVLVTDVDSGAEESFAARARQNGRLVRVASPAELEERSGVICTATSVGVGDGPVLDGGRLQPDVHINSVGSDMAGKTELPLAVLRSAVVCPDHRGQAMREGECQQLEPTEIGPELPTLLLDQRQATELRAVRTVYDSTGLALADLAMAELFDRLAAEFDVGLEIAIESNSGDPRDPYGFLISQAITEG